MATKTYQELIDELNAAIRSAGVNGKTSAADVRAFLASLIEQVILRSEESILSTDLVSALTQTSQPATATNHFVTESELFNITQSAIILLRPNGKRYFFNSATSTWGEAQSGDIFLLQKPINDQAINASQQQINLQPGVSLYTQGFAIGNTSTNGNAITLQGGTGRILGGESTIFSNSPNSWGLGNFLNSQSSTIDYEVAQLNFVSKNTAICISLQESAKLNFAGNLLAAGKAIDLKRSAKLVGVGNIIATGSEPAILCQTNAQITWRGSISLQGSSQLVLTTGSTLSLKSCIVDGQTNRSSSNHILLTADTTSTVVLTDTTILGDNTQVVVIASKVVLRGNTIVVGIIQATEIIDERPSAKSLPPITTSYLALPVPQLALRNPNAFTLDESFHSKNSVRVVFNTPLSDEILALNPEIWLFRYNQRRRQSAQGTRQRTGWGHPTHRDGERGGYWGGSGREPFDTEFFAPELTINLQGRQPYMDLPIRVSQWMIDGSDGRFYAKGKRGMNHRFRFALVIDAPAAQTNPTGKVIGPLSDEVILGDGGGHLAFRSPVYNHS